MDSTLIGGLAPLTFLLAVLVLISSFLKSYVLVMISGHFDQMGPKFIILMAVAVEAGAASIGASELANVYDDVRLLCMTTLGSLVGAFLAIAIFTPDNDTDIKRLKKLSLKFGASLGCGLTITPLGLRTFGWMFNWDYFQADILVGSSTIVAALMVYSIHKIIPILEERKLARERRAEIINNIYNTNSNQGNLNQGDHCGRDDKQL